MQIVLRGVRQDEPLDPLIVLPPALLDHQAIIGPASKQRREDLQIQSFALMLGLHHDYSTCLEIINCDDPPDRVVKIAGETIAVELTELTFANVRRGFAQVRQLARNIDDALQIKKDDYPHLFGRAVHLSFSQHKGRLPKDLKSIESEVLEILRENRGYVGEDLEDLEGLPSKYPSTHRGFYRGVDPVNIQVSRYGTRGEIFVVGAAQAEFSHSELKSELQKIVTRKDQAKNCLLLISCGQPDEKGCICPVDKSLFDEVPNLLGSLEISPKFLKCIFLHLWGTEHAVELFRAEDYSPSWPPKWPIG
jgi:hypothetical protein